MIISGVGFAVPAFTTNIFVIGSSFVLSGFFVVVWNVITVSLRQRIVPDQLLGRLNSAYRLLAWGTQPIGALAGGLIGQFIGLQAVFVMAAVLGLTLLLTRAVLTEDALRAAEAEGAPTAA